MGLLQKIMALFGSGISAPKPENSPGQDTDDDILASLRTFKNRPIHKELTAAIIDNTPDEDLLQVIFDNLLSKHPADFEKEYERVMSWNPARQAIYMIWFLESEVNNGGYNQFYYNSSGQFYRHLPDALRRIGAHRFAELTERANKIYEQEKESITGQQDGTLEGFSQSYEENPLNDLDTEFYHLYQEEDLQELQVAFIRKNKSDFIDQ